MAVIQTGLGRRLAPRGSKERRVAPPLGIKTAAGSALLDQPCPRTLPDDAAPSEESALEQASGGPVSERRASAAAAAPPVRPWRKNDYGLDWLWLRDTGCFGWNNWLCKSRQRSISSSWSPVWWFSRAGYLPAVSRSKEHLAFSDCIWNLDRCDGNEIL